MIKIEIKTIFIITIQSGIGYLSMKIGFPLSHKITNRIFLHSKVVRWFKASNYVINNILPNNSTHASYGSVRGEPVGHNVRKTLVASSACKFMRYHGLSIFC